MAMATRKTIRIIGGIVVRNVVEIATRETAIRLI